MAGAPIRFNPQGNLASTLGRALREQPTISKRLLDALVVQPIDDAWWSLTNPIDALTGQGRAANQTMAIPIGGRYTPRTPNLKAELAEVGDDFVTWSGNRRLVEPSSPYDIQKQRYYNLRNESNEIVGSASRVGSGKGRAYVPEMWVDEAYRNTPAMFDMYRLLSRGGKEKLTATFANKDLKRIHALKMSRELRKEVDDLVKSGADAEQISRLQNQMYEFENIAKSIPKRAPARKRKKEQAEQRSDYDDYTEPYGDLAEQNPMTPFGPARAGITQGEIDEIVRISVDDPARALRIANRLRDTTHVPDYLIRSIERRAEQMTPHPSLNKEAVNNLSQRWGQTPASLQQTLLEVPEGLSAGHYHAERIALARAARQRRIHDEMVARSSANLQARLAQHPPRRRVPDPLSRPGVTPPRRRGGR